MRARPYGEMMRQSIIDMLRYYPNQKFSTSDIAIYINTSYLSAHEHLKQMREKNPYRNFKWEISRNKLKVYWWAEK